MMSTLIIHCQWEDETVRERNGHPPSYDEAKKMKSLTLHTHGCLKASFRDCSSSSLLNTMGWNICSICANILTGLLYETRALTVRVHGKIRHGGRVLPICLRGHPFMTSTRRGDRLRWTHVDGGGSNPMWTFTQKIKNSTLMSSCLLLMQRSWCLFYQNFIFRRNKKWKIFAI